MKIKLSKSQWETIGKTAGWTKTAQQAPQQQQQAPQQQQQQKAFTPRHEAAINLYNLCFNKNVAATREGYDSIGGGEGIIQSIANDPNAFHVFASRQKTYTPASLVKAYLLEISRGK